MVYALHVERIGRAPWHMQAALREDFEAALVAEHQPLSVEQRELRAALGV